MSSTTLCGGGGDAQKPLFSEILTEWWGSRKRRQLVDMWRRLASYLTVVNKWSSGVSVSSERRRRRPIISCRAPPPCTAAWCWTVHEGLITCLSDDVTLSSRITASIVTQSTQTSHEFAACCSLPSMLRWRSLMHPSRTILQLQPPHKNACRFPSVSSFII